MKGKNLAGTLLFVLSAIFIFSAMYAEFSFPFYFLGKIALFGLAFITAIFATLILVLPEEKIFWLLGFFVFSVLLIVDLLIPDPVPVLDEMVLAIGTTMFGAKSVLR